MPGLTPEQEAQIRLEKAGVYETLMRGLYASSATHKLERVIIMPGGKKRLNIAFVEIAAILTWGRSRFELIPGIGRKKATRIRQALDEIDSGSGK